MKKSWSHLWFLVLAVSSTSRGQSENNTVMQTDSPNVMTTSPYPDENNGMTSSSLQNHTSANATDLLTNVFTTQNETLTTSKHGVKEDGLITALQTTTSARVSKSGKGVHTESVTMATTSTSSETVKIEDKDSSSWGYVILVLIVLVIIGLCIILYLLRRVSRTYSFDLQRPIPANNRNEPPGTFEPVNLDDLDRPPSKDRVTNDYSSLPPVANGTTPQTEEKGSNGENGLQEQPDANSLASSFIGSPTFDNTSDPFGIDSTFFFHPVEKSRDPTGEEQQNENNNNPSVCSSDPFVEINLDEPAWCDQFLTSPELPPSVLPFSPFPFSASSSYSSSSS